MQTVMQAGALSLFVFFLLINCSTCQPPAQTGTPITLTNADKSALISRMNIRRAAKNAVVMNCIRYWTNQLAAYAQTIAVQCNTVPPADTVHPIMITSSAANNINTAFEFLDDVEFFYNPSTQQCPSPLDPANPIYSNQQCGHYTQLTYFNANATGCAAATCNAIVPANGPPDGQNVQAGVVWVCAFGERPAADRPPYIVPPAGIILPCVACPNAKQVCSEQDTMNLCCEGAAADVVIEPATDGTSVGGQGLCGDQPQISNLTNVYRYYDNALSANYLSFDNVTDTFPPQLSTEPARFTVLGPAGSVVLPNETANECPYLQPIYHMFHEPAVKNIYVIDTLEMSSLERDGYKRKAVVGQAVSGMGMCNATIAMYRFFNPGSGVVQLSNVTDVEMVLKGMPPGFNFQGISFYLWPPVEY